ncbi:MAG: hypothetical protein V3U80_06215 [Flavobacteriaceae bacterium]
MKKSSTLIFALFIVAQLIAQENNVFTKSVQIKSFIPYVANNFKVATDSTVTNNITFLIPATVTDEITENSILLKQGFRLLSDKLGENDKITLIAYSGLNGEFLPPTSAKEIKKILYALNNIETGIKVTVEDGVQLGYDKADENFDIQSINTVVLIRDSNATNAVVKTENKTVKKEKKEKKVRSNVILLTIISLAPEVLRILKDK